MDLRGQIMKIVMMQTPAKIAETGSNCAVLEMPCTFFAEPSEENKKKPLWKASQLFEILKETPLTPGFSNTLDGAFEPSPFGHGGQTVVDETVRKAMQVRPVGFTTRPNG